MKKYVILDSNIIVSFFESGFSVAQPKGILISPEQTIVLKNLLKALTENKLILILPDVIIFECERIKEEKKEELDKLYNNASEKIDEASILNRKLSSDSSGKIKKKICSLCVGEKDKVNEIWKLFSKIAHHKNTHIVKLDEKILLDSYKRGLIGKKPFVIRFTTSKDHSFNNKPVNDIQTDCVIVESVKSFLKGKKNFEVYLATNDSNFYTAVDKKNIDPSIKKDLMIKSSYLSLSDLLEETIGIKPPKRKDVTKEKQVDAFPVMQKSSIEEGKFDESSEIVKG